MGFSNSDNADFILKVKEQRAKAKQAVRDFVQGAIEGNPERMWSTFQLLEFGDVYGGGWLNAMRAVSRLPSVPRVTTQFFLRVLIKYGDKLRQECSDLILADGLRVLLPKYKGPDMHLYRGDSFLNRSRRTYGLSWTSSVEVARNHAKGFWIHSEGGSVVIETHAPRDAIICKVPKSEDRYNEAEYVVDRRRLTTVKVVERFAQLPLEH